jgi:glucokinase
MAYNLVADIGGTNARFALCDKGSTALQNIQIFRCTQFDSPIEAIEKYLSTTSVSVESACLAVAGPVNEADDRVKLTNNPWSFSRNKLADQIDCGRLVVINDFVAAAMATTAIHSDDLFFLSDGPRFNLKQQRCILGPGTGLGVAGMLPYLEKTLVLSTEGGNRSFSPENEIEDYILHFLRVELKRVSCEALLSGNGLVNIYRALCSYHKQTAIYSKADDISKAAFEKDDMAHKTLQTFFEILGNVAGDCALTLGATGGVYIGGGIAPKFPEALLNSNFRERFENKLNYRSYLRKIPTAIVMHKHAGLLGAAAYLKTFF